MKKTKHAMVTIPGLGEYGVLNYEVNSTDVLVGAVAGLAGSGALKLAISKLNVTLPDFVTKFWPLIASTAVGGILFAVQKDSNPNRGKGHMVGAIGAGVSLTAWDMLKAQLPEYFGEVVSLNLGRYRGMGGLLVNDPKHLGGLLVNDPKTLSDYNLGQLAGASLGDGESSGMEELMDLD